MRPEENARFCVLSVVYSPSENNLDPILLNISAPIFQE